MESVSVALNQTASESFELQLTSTGICVVVAEMASMLLDPSKQIPKLFASSRARLVCDTVWLQTYKIL